MREEFSQLLTATQEECAKRIDSLTQHLTKDGEVTANLIQAEAQKREALKEQLMSYIHFPTPGDDSGPAPPAVLHDMGPGPSMLEELLNSRTSALSEAMRAGLDALRAETESIVNVLGDTFQSKLQVLEDTILAVNTTAQELSEKMAQELEGHREGSDPWSDWDLLECPDFLELRKRSTTSRVVPLPDLTQTVPQPISRSRISSSASPILKARGLADTLEEYPKVPAGTR